MLVFTTELDFRINAGFGFSNMLSLNLNLFCHHNKFVIYFELQMLLKYQLFLWS